MEILGKIFMFGGFFSAIISQLYIISLAFKVRFSAGLFCLLVTPIYAFNSDLRKDKKIRMLLKVWVASFVAIVLGIFILAGA